MIGFSLYAEMKIGRYSRASNTIMKGKDVPTNHLYHRPPSDRNKPDDQKMSPAEFMKAEFERLNRALILLNSNVNYFNWLAHCLIMFVAEKT